MTSTEISQFYIKECKPLVGKWDSTDNYNIYYEFNILPNKPEELILWLQGHFSDDYIDEITNLLKSHNIFGKHCRLFDDNMLFTICFIDNNSKVIMFKNIMVSINSSFTEVKKYTRRISDLFRLT